VVANFNKVLTFIMNVKGTHSVPPNTTTCFDSITLGSIGGMEEVVINFANVNDCGN
jgi:hypothetical protein